MLLQIIAVTPGEHLPPQISGVAGMLSSPLSPAGTAQAKLLQRHLEHMPIDSEYASEFVFCTQTAQVVARLPNDLDVHPIEHGFEQLPVSERYADAFVSLGYGSLREYLDICRDLIEVGAGIWQSLYDHLCMVDVHMALVVMPPGLLQATMLQAVPRSDRSMIIADAVGPCEGFQIRISSNGHVVDAAALKTAA